MDPHPERKTPIVGAAGSSVETWDRAAATYDTERSDDLVYQACLASTRRLVEAIRPSRLLDVGCGTGLTTLPLCRRGRQVVAVDYSHSSVGVLRAKPGAPPALQADLCALPFKSGSFDVVMCANTLQHLRPAIHELAIAELQRLVAPGGALVVTVHHFSESKRRAGWIKEGRPGQPGIDYIYRFTTADLSRLLPAARVTAMGFPEWSWLPLAAQVALASSRLGPWLARRGRGHMIAAVHHAPH